jgi:hypothetical protein
VSIAPAGFIYLFVNGVQSQIQENRNGTTIGGYYYGVVQGTPVNSTNPLVIGQFNQVACQVYVADLRFTTGAGLYTGLPGSYATFTVPSAPLSSTTSPGVTQFLLRAGQNSPTVQNGALTFDRGLKQFLNFGPQTFNIATQGFTAIVRFQFTGTVANYERIIELGNYLTNGYIIIGRFDANQTVYWSVAPSNSSTAAFNQYLSTTFVQGTTYVLAFRYNPVTGIADSWVNGVPNQSTPVSAATLVADRIISTTYIGREGTDGRKTLSGSANTFAVYNRALSNVEIYNSYLALSTNTINAPIEIGDVNGTPALSIAGDGRVNVTKLGQTANVLPWPPAAMTGYVTSINGGIYRASDSTEFNTTLFGAWQAFDKNPSNQWSSGQPLYSTSAPYAYTGTVTTADVNGTVYPGEWLQIQLPSSVTLSSYSIYGVNGTNQMPGKWVVLGSRDGVNWFLVDSQKTAILYTATTGFSSFSVISTQGYSYYRVVINQISGNSTYQCATILDLVLYGTADTAQTLTVAQPVTLSYGAQTASLTGISGDKYVPQDFSSSGLNIPAYITTSNASSASNVIVPSSFGPFTGQGSLYYPGGSAPPTLKMPYTTAPSLNFNPFTGDFTAEAWVYNTVATTYNTIVGNYPEDWAFKIVSDRTVQFYDYNTGAALGFNLTGGTVPLNTWTHVAVTYSSSGTTARIFVNGTLATSTGTYTGTPRFTSTQLEVGSFNNGSHLFNGYIGEVRIVRGAALYTSAFTPPTTPLQPIQGVTQAGTPYGTVLLLRNAPAPGRVLTQKFGGTNSGSVLSFPPAAMTSNAIMISNGYGQGMYVVNASAVFSGTFPYNAFDKNTTSQWGGQSGQYGSGSFPYLYVGGSPPKTVDVIGNSYTGDWIQLQMPSAVVLTSYSIYYNTSLGCPGLFYILGSSDGSNWNLVDQRTQTPPASSGYITFSVNSSQAFTYFRLQAYGITTTGGTMNVPELIYNGTIEGPNVTADGRLGVGVSNPVQALEVAGNMVTGGTVSSGTGLMFRNALYNGDFRIAQRGTSFSNPTSQYTLDRWFLSAYGAAGNGTLSQIQSGLANFSNAIQLAVTSTTNGNWSITQSLETRDVVRFQGQPVTLSYWYRIPTSFTSQWTAELVWNTSVDTRQPDVSVASTSVGGLVLTNTTAWTYGTFTGFVPPTAQALTARFLAYNNVVNGATIQITGVQLEKGTVATPFEFRPYATELALCQRYYTEIPFSGSHFTGGGTGGGRTIGSLAATNGAVCCTGIYFPVSMRINPTPNYYGAGSSPGVFTFYTGSSGAQVGVVQSTSNVVTAQISTMMLAINISTTSIIATGGSSGWFDMGWGSTSLGITLSAEL